MLFHIGILSQVLFLLIGVDPRASTAVYDGVGSVLRLPRTRKAP